MEGHLLLGNPSSLKSKILKLPKDYRVIWDRMKRDVVINSKPQFNEIVFVGMLEKDNSLLQKAAGLWRERMSNLASECRKWGFQAGPQMHTWCHSAPTSRQALCYSWMAQTPGLFKKSEMKRWADELVEYGWLYPGQFLDSRTPPHTNNQGVSMAFACITIGAVFGYKLGSDPRARKLMDHGLKHWIWQLERFPRGAYTGEGSTYYMDVVAPMCALCCQIVEEITGEKWFDRAIGPNQITMRDILSYSIEAASPSGLMPGIDNYGLMKASTNLCPKIYYAVRSGQPHLAAFFLKMAGWNSGRGMAWGGDDNVWSLIFMPEKPSMEIPATKPWLRPDMAGRLVDGDENLQLLQVWDFTCFPPGRMHCDPNAVHLEAYGEILTFDGTPQKDSPINKLGEVIECNVKERNVAATPIGQGAIGGHSCLIVDRERGYACKDSKHTDYLPGLAAQGKAEDYCELPGLGAVAANATRIYSGYPDIKRISRTSLLLDERLWLVSDRASADKPHEFSSQLIIRHPMRKVQGGVRMDSPDGFVSMDILPITKDAGVDIEEIQGFNVMKGQSSYHCSRHSRKCDDLSMAAALVPHCNFTAVENLTEGWRFCPDSGQDMSKPEINHSKWPLLPLDRSWRSCGVETDGDAGWYRKSISIPSIKKGERLFMEFGIPPKAAHLYIDGKLTCKYDINDMAQHDINSILTWRVDLTEFAGDRAKTVLAAVKAEHFFQMRRYTLFDGPVHMIVVKPAAKVAKVISSTGGAATISMGDNDQVHAVYDNPEMHLCKSGPWTTNAALSSCGRICAFHKVTRAEDGGDSWLRSDEALDISWADKVITIDNPPVNFRMGLFLPGLELVIDRAMKMVVLYKSREPWKIVFKRMKRTDVKLNGKPVKLSGSGDELCISLPRGGKAMPVKKWLKDLSSKDPVARVEAAVNLGFVKAKGVVSSLERQLLEEPPFKSYKDGQINIWMVRQQILVSLGMQGSPSSAKVVEKNVTCDDFYPVRRKAAVCLSQLYTDEAERLLEVFAKDPDPETYAVAKSGLKALKSFRDSIK